MEPLKRVPRQSTASLPERCGIQRNLIRRQLLIKRQDITAYCVAEQYDIARVVHILRNEGYVTDPFVTGLYPQVVHIQIEGASTDSSGQAVGDIFVFPSGTLVGWDVSESAVSTLASKTLLPAAINPHLKQLETEDLEYVEDRTKESSIIKGDTIILGTKGRSQPRNEPPQATEPERSVLDGKGEAIDIIPHDSKVDTVLAKIAFSSGLARSTKLAVLESLLSDYFESTRSIPTQLSHGSRLPFTRSFVLQKTGQLLSVRAQLNLYSELTDSLPDIFWDSRHELGLEGYYDQVGRALDIGVRIKVLNEKMDYSQEIASVLREQLSEKHSLRLEWIIIALIAVEVCFEIRREWRDADAGV
ncbi:hypothetical protein MMC09_002440 [Bachmanniomyces sp. S44760]|nr:hypothetical protein [Bachmanniomyces sp. S44760]